VVVGDGDAARVDDEARAAADALVGTELGIDEGALRDAGTVDAGTVVTGRLTGG
jgi:hypothetical protein